LQIRRALKTFGTAVLIAFTGMIWFIVFMGAWAIVRPSTCGHLSNCLNNLKWIDGAKITWASESRKTNLNEIPTDSEIFGVTNYIRDKPICPDGGSYTMGPLSEKPRCSIPDHNLEYGDIYILDHKNNGIEGATVTIAASSAKSVSGLTATNGFVYLYVRNIGTPKQISVNKPGYLAYKAAFSDRWPLKIVLHRSAAAASKPAI
jgi:hypothetical protein